MPPCERVYEDRASGASADRRNLVACFDYRRRGDSLVIFDLDRVRRLVGELITLIDELSERDIGFRAFNSPMDTTTLAGRAILQIQTTFAEMERNVIRQRMREGVKAARARGRKGGRPHIVTPQKLRYAQGLIADQRRSIPDICRELGDFPASALYHYLQAYGTFKRPDQWLLTPWARDHQAERVGIGTETGSRANLVPPGHQAPGGRLLRANHQGIATCQSTSG